MRTIAPRGALYGPSGRVASQVTIASTFVARLVGLVGRRRLDSEEALVIHPCRRVHTYGLTFSIDVVFCDGDLRVLHVETLVPRRLSRRPAGARTCIELAAGRAAASGLEPGVVLEVR